MKTNSFQLSQVAELVSMLASDLEAVCSNLSGNMKTHNTQSHNLSGDMKSLHVVWGLLSSVEISLHCLDSVWSVTPTV